MDPEGYLRSQAWTEEDNEEEPDSIGDTALLRKDPLPPSTHTSEPGEGDDLAENHATCGQRSHRAGSSSFHGFLHPDVRGKEGISRLKADSCPKRPQQVCFEVQLQDGDSQVVPFAHQRGGLAVLHRPEGRLPADPDTSGVLSSTPVFVGTAGVTIQVFLLRPNLGTKVFT